MDVNQLTEWIGQYGYVALFFCLWLGIVGMPIPDEVIVMTGGFVTSLGILQLVPSFILTYLGVVSGLTIGYLVGRYFGASWSKRLQQKEKWRIYIDRSERLVNHYGSFAIPISYLLPVVRHLLPYIVGSNRMKFTQYALYSYTTGFVWTLGFFFLGYQFGDAIPYIATLSSTWGYTLLFTIIGIILAIQLFRFFRQKKLENENS